MYVSFYNGVGLTSMKIASMSIIGRQLFPYAKWQRAILNAKTIGFRFVCGMCSRSSFQNSNWKDAKACNEILNINTAYMCLGQE